MNIGDRIGNIRIEKRLGEGGMGEVFEGFDERLLRRVAVKALSDGNWRPIQQARLDALIEAERLGHPVMLPLEKRWAAWKDRDTSADQPPNREDS